MAFRDPVTQLPSEALFMDRLSQALALARRQRTKTAVIHLDLLAPDALRDDPDLLRALAQRLQPILRASDTVARLDGHDFSVLLIDVDSRKAAQAVQEELVLAASKPLTVNGRELRFDTRAGLALFPDDAADEAALLRVATPERQQPAA